MPGQRQVALHYVAAVQKPASLKSTVATAIRQNHCWQDHGKRGETRRGGGTNLNRREAENAEGVKKQRQKDGGKKMGKGGREIEEEGDEEQEEEEEARVA